MVDKRSWVEKSLDIGLLRDRSCNGIENSTSGVKIRWHLWTEYIYSTLEFNILQ